MLPVLRDSIVFEVASAVALKALNKAKDVKSSLHLSYRIRARD